MLATKDYGFRTEYIDSSCPAEIKPYMQSFELQQKMRDEEFWRLWGIYGISAMGTVICNAVSKGTRMHFIDKPVLQQSDKLNEEELQKQRVLFVEKLKTMKTNYELSHPKKSE